MGAEQGQQGDPEAVEAVIFLGINHGDHAAIPRGAVRPLAGTPGVRLLARSSDGGTEPVGVPPVFAGKTYFNAVTMSGTTHPLEAWIARRRKVKHELEQVRPNRSLPGALANLLAALPERPAAARVPPGRGA